MPHTDEITGIQGGVDKNGLPVGLHWTGVRRFTDDEGNALGETRITIPLTREEIEAHVAAGLTSRDADIAADIAQRTQERADFAAAVEAKNAELASKDEEIAALGAEVARLNGIIAEAMAG